MAVGATAIVATGGLAGAAFAGLASGAFTASNILVAGTFIAGTTSIAFGCSDMSEGIVGIAKTVTGDRSAASNPIRDTIFRNDPEDYYITEVVIATAAGNGAAAVAQQYAYLQGTVGNNSGTTTYSPYYPGPLNERTANNFSGGVYTERTLTEDTTMYRVYGGSAGKVGSYLSETPQNGGLQSQLDLALNPQWGNTTEYVTEVIVPKGTVIYEGTAAAQNIYDSSGNVIGTLPGGGSQVYIPNVEIYWFN